MTTNFEELPVLAFTTYDFCTFIYWALWSQGYAAMTRDCWWALPINLYFFGGVLNFML